MTATFRQQAERLLLEARVDVRAAQAVLRTCSHQQPTEQPRQPVRAAQPTRGMK